MSSRRIAGAQWTTNPRAKSERSEVGGATQRRLGGAGRARRAQRPGLQRLRGKRPATRAHRREVYDRAVGVSLEISVRGPKLHTRGGARAGLVGPTRSPNNPCGARRPCRRRESCTAAVASRPNRLAWPATRAHPARGRAQPDLATGPRVRPSQPEARLPRCAGGSFGSSTLAGGAKTRADEELAALLVSRATHDRVSRMRPAKA
jgi:hypothetical protein